MFTGFTNKIKTAIARIKGRTDLVICAVCVAVVVAVLCVSVSLIVKYNSKISDLEKSVSNLEQERNNLEEINNIKNDTIQDQENSANEKD